MSGLGAEMGDVDPRHGVGRLDEQALAGQKAEKSLPCPQHRERAGKAARIEHRVVMPAGDILSVSLLSVFLRHDAMLFAESKAG